MRTLDYQPLQPRTGRLQRVGARFYIAVVILFILIAGQWLYQRHLADVRFREQQRLSLMRQRLWSLELKPRSKLTPADQAELKDLKAKEFSGKLNP